MSDNFFLPLKEKARVVDFLVDQLTYADAKNQEAAQALISAYQDGEHVSTDKLADFARKFAIAVWPAREALKLYFAEHPSQEWETLNLTVRPSTAHLLERARRASKTKTVDEVLAHAESDVALQEGERIEIAEVRKHVWHDQWRKHETELKEQKAKAELELKKYLGQLKTLRDLAVDLSGGLQDDLFSKIAHLEDSIFFEGNKIPPEIIQEEIAYYTEQKEIGSVD